MQNLINTRKSMNIAESKPISLGTEVLEGVYLEAYKNIGNPEALEQIQKVAFEILDDIAKNSSVTSEEKTCLDQLKKRITQIVCEAKSEKKELSPSKIFFSSPKTVEGKGDCLFLSISDGLVEISKKNKESYSKYLAEVQRDVDQDPKQKQISEDLRSLRKILAQKDTIALDQLQRALRNLACSYNEYHNPHFAEGDPKTYFAKMRKSGTWGGALEIAALSNLLGVEIDVEGFLRMPGKLNYGISLKYVNSNHFNSGGAYYLEKSTSPLQ